MCYTCSIATKVPSSLSIRRRIQILHEDSHAEFATFIENVRKKAIAKGEGTSWTVYYEALRMFADVSYNYAITAHKAQGSTYENVFILEDDIDENRDLIERNRIKYTAYTRASKRLFIFKKVKT